MPFLDMPGGVAFGIDKPDDTAAKGGALAAFGRHALGAAGPAAVGLAAGIPAAEAATVASLPLLGPFAPVAGAIAGLGVGGVAAYGAGRAQKALLDANPRVQQALGQDPATQQQDEQDHPVAAFAGDLAPNLAAFRPASINPLTGFGYLSKGVSASAKVAGVVNAGVSGATELAQQMGGDQPIDLTRVAMATGAGALGMKETFVGGKIAGVGRAALGIQPQIDARMGVGANDGSVDQGAAGGAGIADGTSTENNPFVDANSNQMALPVGAAENQFPPAGYAGAQPTQAPPEATPIRGPMNQPPAPQPMAEAPPQPQAPSPPGQRDAFSVHHAVAMNFSPMQVLRDLRDAAGSADKPATPDSYMLQLANGISKQLSPDDPQGHAIHGYLSDQLQILNAQSEQLKDHVIENQIKKPNTPEQVKAQEQQAKDLDSARTQTERQIKTLSAAQDAMPQMLARLGEHIDTAQGQHQAETAFDLKARVGPAVAQALKQAKDRIATGDTAGTKTAAPDASPAGTVDQMTARNVADAAQAASAQAQIAGAAAHQAAMAATAHTDAVVQGAQEIHTAKVRDGILQSVLDDPTTINPMSRFRVELRKAGVRDLSVSEAEASKIGKFEDARAAFSEPDRIPSSPNEMDPGLVPEAQPKGDAGTPPAALPDRAHNLSAERFALEPPPGQRDAAALDAAQAKRARQAAARAGPAPDVPREASSGQGKLFTARGKPTVAADQVPPIKPEVPAELPQPQVPTKAEPNRDITSRRDIVREAGRRKLLDNPTMFKLMQELRQPKPNLDMVDATIAKAAKRGEAMDKAQGVDSDQAKIDAFIKRRDAEAPQTSLEDRVAAEAHTPDNPELQNSQDYEDAKAAQDAADNSLDVPLERPGTPTGMSQADVQSAVADHTKGWTGGPKVQVHQDMSTLPDHLQGGTPSGVYDPKTKTVHLIANHIASPSDAHAALFHEALGHYGLRKVFGDRLDKVLTNVYATNPKMRAAADAWIAEHNIQGSPLNKLSPTELKVRAMDEVFATQSESGPSQTGGVKGAVARIKGVVRDVARRMGIVKDYNHDDVANILRRAHASVTTGAPPTGTGRAASVPIQRPGSVGGSVAQRMQNLTNPDMMKTTAEDILTNMGGKVRRGLRNFQDLNWLVESHDKAFVLNGEHLLPQWKDNLSMKDASKAAAIQKAKGPHDLYLDLAPKSKASVDSLLLDGTLARVEVREPRDPEKPPPGDVEQGLRDRYAALDPKGRAAYDGMRQQFTDEQKQYRDILKGVIDSRDISDDEKTALKDEVDAKLKTTPGYYPLMRFGDFSVVGESPEWAKANTALEALKKSAPGSDELKAATKKFDAMQDQHRSVTTFENESEMKRHAADLRKQGWAAREKLTSDFSAAVDGVAGKFMSGIMDHLDTQAELHPDQADGIAGIKSMINQQYLSQMPASSAMKRQMTRKGVAGFSADVGRVYAASTQRTAGFLAEIKHGMVASDLLEKMRTVADSGEGIHKKEIYNQLKKNFDLSKEYSNAPVTRFLNQASYAYYLGGSASFTVMHTMQTPMVTLPMLAAHFGYGDASGSLMKSAGEVLGSYFSKYYHPGQEHLVGKTAGEQNAIKMLVAHNLISGTETAQFMNASMGSPNVLSKAGRAIMAVASYAPHHVERANRMLTALSAFRLAMKDPKMAAGVNDAGSEHYISDQEHQQFKSTHPGLEGMSKQELGAARLAEKITADSHVDYSSTNSSYVLGRLAKTPVIAWAAQFQKYQFGMLKVLGQNASRALDKSLTPAENKIAQRTLAGVIGTHALMTGMMGLPLAGLSILAANIYHKVLGNDDEPFDAETSFRNGLAKLLGKDAGDVAARGLLYAPGLRSVLPADITDRLGMGDLGNFANQTRVAEKINSDSLMAYMGSELTGPVGAMLGNLANMSEFMKEGGYQRAVEEALPKALRDLSKAQRFATAGVTTGTGMPVVSPEEVSTPDIVSQLLGFTPQKVAEAYAQRSAMAQAKAQLEGRRAELIKRFTSAAMEGDDTSDIRDEIKAFNTTQVEDGLRNQQLNMGTVFKVVQERKVAMRRLKGGISIAPRDRALRDQFGNYSAAAAPDESTVE